jgi:hypothetical protein
VGKLKDVVPQDVVLYRYSNRVVHIVDTDACNTITGTAWGHHRAGSKQLKKYYIGVSCFDSQNTLTKSCSK